MINLPILPILICLPLIGLLFILMSSENDEDSIQSKKSAIWTSLSNFLLSLYLPLNFNKDISCLSALELISTWDGQRNTIISSQIINLDPALGIELDYKKIGYLRFGLGNFQKEKLLETLEENITFQPNFGIGINIWSLFIDYSLTDLGNTSSVLYSNIFTIKYKW